MYCVSEEWIHQCIKTRYCTEETEYPVENSHENPPTEKPSENPSISNNLSVSENPSIVSVSINSGTGKQQQQQQQHIVSERKRLVTH